MNQKPESLTADRKALLINLDRSIFGTFAEIGAGQEVARHFFRVGGAAGTIAKTMSAYDMTISDEIYGRTGRYVSRERLQNMLQHEYLLLLERLSEKRGKDTTFFAFANTVAARSFKGTSDCHGWMGVRFQTKPLGPSNDIVIHVRMTDKHNTLQQQALGIIGVNLMYGAFYQRSDPDQFISGLLDELSLERIEVDMIELSGPDLRGIDNRLLSLKLVQRGLTNAAMFSPDGNVLQPSEVMYRKPVLVERGSFRPVTHVNIDMMKGARTKFSDDTSLKGKEPVVLFEITLNNLLATGGLDNSDFLARADSLSTLGYTVLISNYSEHYRLTSYFRRYTQETIGMIMGINTLAQLFDERYYESLEGGMLEALGRLFRFQVRLYVYPMRRENYIDFLKQTDPDLVPKDPNSLPEVITADQIQLRPQMRHLFEYLLAAGSIAPISASNPAYLSYFSRDVLAKIQRNDPAWESAVPAAAAALIKQRAMFGFNGAPQATVEAVAQVETGK